MHKRFTKTEVLRITLLRIYSQNAIFIEGNIEIWGKKKVYLLIKIKSLNEFWLKFSHISNYIIYYLIDNIILI